MRDDTAEGKMKRAMILIVVGILTCAVLAVLGFLHLWGVV
jgi:hypothetical protein